MKVTDAMIKAFNDADFSGAGVADWEDAHVRAGLQAVLDLIEAERAPVTEEPPVGTKLIDKDGDIWVRRAWPGGWDCVDTQLTGVPWGFVRAHAPLRLAP
jgi:hypothetical protein